MVNQETKICSKCAVELPLVDYYSKGGRRDSACKKCIKAGKKTNYVTSNVELSTSRLIQIFDVVYELENKMIQRQIRQLDGVIEKCENRVGL